MSSNIDILVVEVGYVTAVALLTRGVTALAKRIDAWRTTRGLRNAWKALDRVKPAELGPCDYRTNASTTDSSAPRRFGWLERRRAERAARYVQKLEDEATMKS